MKSVIQRQLTLLFIFIIATMLQVKAQSFLHQSGTSIVDGSGNEVILKGLNFGNCMVMEGYMMGTSGYAGTQHAIKAKLIELMGETQTQVFYNAWLDNHVTKADIDSIKKWGFNSVRIPMHYEYFTPLDKPDVWLDKGFQWMDSVVKWCSADKIYAILDLHAAPGGQGTNADISDYDSSKPMLWESMDNKNKTVALWAKLADRYKNEQWVGGYDLINETNGTTTAIMGSKNDSLLTLFKRITKEIRKVDNNHILFIEGNSFANDFTGLTPTWDSNMAYSFHKYWTANNTSNIQWVLNLRTAQNAPLWCGETGENGNANFTNEMNLLNANGIGVAFWPMKKFGATNCFVSATRPASWTPVLNYIKGGTKIDATTAFNAMMDLAASVNIKNCKINYDMLYSIINQPGNSNFKPFKDNHIPGTISLTDYDLGTQGVAYSDEVYENTTGTSGGASWNTGGVYRNDGVDIQACTDTPYTNGYNVGWTSDNEWMKYTVNAESSGLYDVVFRVSSPNNTGIFHLEVNGKDASGLVPVKSTGAWTTWGSDTIKNIYLRKGIDTLRVYIDKAGFNLNAMIWGAPKAVVDLPLRMMSAHTDADGKKVYLAFNNDLKAGQTITPSDFTISGGTGFTISAAALSATDTKQIELTITGDMMFDATYTISYTGTSIKDANNLVLATFTNAPLLNKMATRYYVAGTIEAENFSVNNGMTVETCTDTNGGKDLGYTDANDYTDYLVYVNTDATYSLVVRGAGNGGTAQLLLADSDTKPVLSNITIAATGGWQTWADSKATATFRLTKGYHVLRFFVVTSGYNVNYFTFTLEKVTAVPSLSSVSPNVLSVYPNPSRGVFNIKSASKLTNIEVYDLTGRLIYAANSKTTDQIDLTSAAKGVYVLKVTSNDFTTSQKLVVK
ncbi:MAG: carbohydrate-binding protein [Bacteroidota bacterium]|nr:carbohydrate-binding protein [Bacteroidota bacterium]